MELCRNTMLALSVILLSFKFSLGYENVILKDEQLFDFIIVGGGTGGCVVAARLAESGKHLVLVIHEGGVANDKLNVPALTANYKTDSPNEMKSYGSVPQRNSQLADNGIVRMWIGKSIGGGSSVNGQFWLVARNRGHPQDYNNWAQLLNDSSWNYENMLPFFRKSENYRGNNPTDQRGYGGPISVENTKDLKYGIAEILDSSQEIGYPVGDPNGPQRPSVNLIDYSHFRGRRVSSFAGYIGPLLERAKAKSRSSLPYGHEEKADNLVILLNTEAKRLVFEGDKVVGVTYVSLNSSQSGFAKARKEVVLSAGVIDSPVMLMRSGIGPKSVLDTAGIPVVKYLEGVGKNLQDHVIVRRPIIFGNRSVVLIPSRDLTPEAWKEYQTFGTGPYSVFWGGGAQGFFLSSLQSPFELSWPDLHFVPLHFETQVAETKENEAGVVWGLITTRSKSRGTVTLDLDPQNIDNPPLIDFNYFDHPDDMRAMIDHIKLADEMCEKTSAMQRIGCRIPPTPLAACNHFKFRSDSYYQCTVRQLSDSAVHAAGTCKMGMEQDPEAVVDANLRVMGVQNLRIADASVMPVVTNANTQTPVYAIAERTADIILKQWA